MKDDKHLGLINLLLDKALQEFENGTLKAKSIKDKISLSMCIALIRFKFIRTIFRFLNGIFHFLAVEQ